ncbi:DUF6879 family protein [Spirillospora sp. CA-294931]|uniref:DUF6879 family protein n=1 Tax=Spirillospora sp. CA-294931 TaxID=3240042 RepID=UPI003D8C8A8F
MKSIAAQDRRRLFETFKREALHLEMRDFYDTGDLEKVERWKTGEPDDLEWLKPWCSRVQKDVAKGKRYRRACVVSEPLTEYQMWAYSITQPNLDAGEDIRWVPRRLVSTIPLPGNDFWLFDDDAVVFGIFGGDGNVVERQLFTEPEVVQFCRNAFEAAWAVSIQHHDYQPVRQ